MRGLSAKVVEGVLLVACGPTVPEEADFSEFLQVARATQYRAVWVHTAGGYYDAVQRKRAAGTIRAAEQVAIMADTPLARGAVTAFSWVVRGVRGFKGDAFTDARRYLDASEATESQLIQLIASLRQP